MTKDDTASFQNHSHFSLDFRSIFRFIPPLFILILQSISIYNIASWADLCSFSMKSIKSLFFTSYFDEKREYLPATIKQEV